MESDCPCNKKQGLVSVAFHEAAVITTHYRQNPFMRLYSLVQWSLLIGCTIQVPTQSPIEGYVYRYVEIDLDYDLDVVRNIWF
jgi:hypothetical protein